MRLIRHLTPAGPAYAALEPGGRTFAIAGDPFGACRRTDEEIAIVKPLAPVVPPAIFGIGLNYRRHATDVGRKLLPHPLMFIKSGNTVQNPDDPVELPVTLTSRAVDYEGELAVVIGRAAKNVSREQAWEHVLGITIANDISARDWQFELGGGQFCQSKCFDTFCPLGPVLVTPDELPDVSDLPLRTYVNDVLRQDGRTRDMIFNVPALISFLSASKTLLPGTVILTGSPGGSGHSLVPPVYLKHGDTVRVEIGGVGVLSNPVVSEPSNGAASPFPTNAAAVSLADDGRGSFWSRPAVASPPA